MPPKRDPRRDQAAEIYREQNGNIDLTVIAKQLGVSAGTVRGWKSKDRDAWVIGAEQGSERSEKRSKRSKSKTPLVPGHTSTGKATLENKMLREKEQLFCMLYIQEFNATQAAIGAGYSPHTAGQIGYQLLQKDSIRAEVLRLKEAKAASLLMDTDDLVELHMRMAFANMNQFATYQDDEVTLRESDLTDGQLVAEVSQGRDGVKIKLVDRHKSLAFLERFFIANPMDRHRKEYDQLRYELEQKKLEQQTGGPTGSDGDSEDVVIYIPDNGRDANG